MDDAATPPPTQDPDRQQRADLLPRTDHPEGQAGESALLHRVVEDLAADVAGAPLAQVLAALQQAIDGAGLPPQPEPWLRATAGELAAGRTVVVDHTRAPVGLRPGDSDLPPGGGAPREVPEQAVQAAPVQEG